VRVLIVCERSGVVRRAFRALGHDAWSCDHEAADDASDHHLRMDAIEAAYSLGPWDLLIGHPECTFLANSGNKHLYAGMKLDGGPDAERWARMGAAAQFFNTLWRAPVKRKALENPIMNGHAPRLFGIRRPFQIVQPWQFGDPETKATGLWLSGLMPLRPIYSTWPECRDALGLPPEAKPHARMWRMSPGPERRRKRSETYPGIAAGMAAQWGGSNFTASPKGYPPLSRSAPGDGAVETRL